MAKTVERSRSAKTGKYVTKKYADGHPSTTVTERDKVSKKKGKK
jgi:FMN-dependent NADH-azoreductase